MLVKTVSLSYVKMFYVCNILVQVLQKMMPLSHIFSPIFNEKYFSFYLERSSINNLSKCIHFINEYAEVKYICFQKAIFMFVTLFGLLMVIISLILIKLTSKIYLKLYFRYFNNLSNYRL